MGATALNGPMMGGISVGDLLTDGNIITDMPTNATGTQPQVAAPAPATNVAMTSTIPGLLAMATALGAAPPAQPTPAVPATPPAVAPAVPAPVPAPVANATAGALPVMTSVVGGGGSGFDAALGATIGGGGSDWTVVSPSGVPVAGDMTGATTGGGAGAPIPGSVVGGTGGSLVGGSVVGGGGKDWELVSTNVGGSVVGGATNPSALGGAAAAMSPAAPVATTTPRIAPGARPMPATGGGPVAAADREQAAATQALRAEIAALRADRAGDRAGAGGGTDATDATPATRERAGAAPTATGAPNAAPTGEDGDLLAALRAQAARGANAPDAADTPTPDAAADAPAPTPEPMPAPAPAPAADEPKPDAPKTIDHKIADGETLSKIADKYKTDIATLQKLNDIPNPDLIIAGHVLKVPG